MTYPKAGSPEELAEWLEFLGIADCPCPKKYKSRGRLYDVSMGDGWVRMDTDPACRHHGDDRPDPLPPTRPDRTNPRRRPDAAPI